MKSKNFFLITIFFVCSCATNIQDTQNYYASYLSEVSTKNIIENNLVIGGILEAMPGEILISIKDYTESKNLLEFEVINQFTLKAGFLNKTFYPRETIKILRKLPNEKFLLRVFNECSEWGGEGCLAVHINGDPDRGVFNIYGNKSVIFNWEIVFENYPILEPKYTTFKSFTYKSGSPSQNVDYFFDAYDDGKIILTKKSYKNSNTPNGVFDQEKLVINPYKNSLVIDGKVFEILSVNEKKIILKTINF